MCGLEHFEHMREGSGYNCGRCLGPTDEDDVGRVPDEIAFARSESVEPGDTFRGELGECGVRGAGTRPGSRGVEGVAADITICAGAAALGLLSVRFEL
jgi:hypothetical protein